MFDFHRCRAPRSEGLLNLLKKLGPVIRSDIAMAKLQFVNCVNDMVIWWYHPKNCLFLFQHQHKVVYEVCIV